jgi:hypothetical protein
MEPKLDRYKFAVEVFIGELKRAEPTPEGLASAEGPFNPGVTYVFVVFTPFSYALNDACVTSIRPAYFLAGLV